MTQLDGRLTQLLDDARDGGGPIVVLTGAGISAESGIPTFRGPEGYWTIGSENYRPEQLATLAAFRQMPEEIWGWYLYRLGVCAAAAPNPAHTALAELERALHDRFVLVTQNVDGLHLAAGNSSERTWQIHGNIRFVRCAKPCNVSIAPLSAAVPTTWAKDRRLDPDTATLLKCEGCGDWLRPHVLWFDECYDEERYRFDSALGAAERSGLLLVIGTSGATTLPHHMVQTVYQRGAPLVVVNRDPSPFTDAADANPRGISAFGAAGDIVPAICERLS